MTLSNEKGKQFKCFINTLKNHMLLTIHQIDMIKVEFVKTEETVMENVLSIDQLTNKEKSNAEQLMIDTHLNPDQESEKHMLNAQASADEIFESALNTEDSDPNSTIEDCHNKAKNRRDAGKFSKNAEAISMLSEKLQHTLTNLVGALSEDDLIFQRLENVKDATNYMVMYLSNLDEKFESKFNDSQIKSAQFEILDTVNKRLVSTDETKLFEKFYSDYATKWVFHSDKPVEKHVELATILLSFISTYCLYLKEQLSEISDQVINVVQGAIGSILEIDGVTNEKIKHADTMLLPDTDGDGNCIRSSIKEYEAEVLKIDAEETQQTSKIFITQDMLKSVESDLSEKVLHMMGELSIEDLIVQRIMHIKFALNGISQMLEFNIRNFSKQLKLNRFQKTNDELLEYIYNSYTLEKEKEELADFFPDFIKEAS